MSRSRVAFGLAATLLAVLAVGFAFREARMAAAAAAVERGQRARRLVLESQFREAQRELERARRGRQSLQQLAAQREGAAPDGPGAGGAASGAAFSRSAWFAAHPEARSRYLRAFRDGLSTTWGLLFKTLNLSPEQQGKLEDLLAQREDDDITVEAAASARGLDVSAPDIQALSDELDATNKAAMKDLLGKAQYAAVHAYMHDEDVLPLVDALAENVYNTSAPLTGDQALALTQALADSSQKKESGRVIEGTVDWEQAMARAQVILAPQQRDAFTLIRAEAESKAAVDGMMRSLVAPPPAKGGP